MMTLARLTYSGTLSASHQLIVFSKGKTLPRKLPHGDLLASVLKRRDVKPEELAKSPVAANAADGTLVAWAMLDADKNVWMSSR
jgi:leucyl aminopeptidase